MLKKEIYYVRPLLKKLKMLKKKLCETPVEKVENVEKKTISCVRPLLKKLKMLKKKLYETRVEKVLKKSYLSPLLKKLKINKLF